MNRNAGWIFIALIIGIALGVISGYLLFEEPSRDDRSSETTLAFDKNRHSAPGLERGDDATPSKDMFAIEPLREAIEIDVEAGPEVGELSASIEAFVANAPPPTKPKGHGRITGHVRDEADHPVSGVVVVATLAGRPREPGRAGDGPPARMSLDARLKDSLDAFYRDHETRHESVTDETGAFVLEGLRDSPYDLAAYKSGYTCEAFGSTRVRVEIGQDLRFLARALVELPISVALPQGSSPKMAIIETRTSPSDDQARWSSQKWTPDRPGIRLRPGSYEVKAVLDPERSRHYRGESLSSDTITVTLTHEQPPEPLSFQLQTSAGIEGRVVFDPDTTMTNARVYLQKLGPDSEPELDLLSDSDINDWLSARRPSFTFPDLTPGRYVVGVSRSYNAPIACHEVVSVEDRMISVELVIPPIDTSTHLLVTVQDHQNKPLEDVGFTLRRETERGSSSRSGSSVRLADGRYALSPSDEYARILDATWPDGVTYSLNVSASSYGSKEVSLQPGVREHLVRFESAAHLEVTLSGFVESEHAQTVSVRLEKITDDSDQTRHFYSGDKTRWTPEGRTTVGPVEVGLYALKLAVDDNRYGRKDVAEHEVSLRPGENRITVSMPALYTLRVSFPEAEIGSSVFMKSAEEDAFYDFREVDENREVMFKNLPAGSYTINLQDGASPEMMSVTVPGSSSIVFAPQPINCLKVWIQDPSQALSTAGFRDGDLVVAIDGKEFSSGLELQSTFLASMTKDKVTMTVLRGRRTLEIELDPKLLMGNQNLGGSLEPWAR